MPTPSTPTRAVPTRAVPFARRSMTLLGLVSLFGVLALTWPFFIPSSASPDTAHAADAPWLFAVALPLMLAVLFAELGEGALDAKAVAVLGVLTAAGAALRLPSGGLTGVSLVFFLLILAGRVFGPGFGFVLGALTLLTSAFITGGVGPWLPFQMFGAGWVGFFAGCLPSVRGRWELVMLATYGALSGLMFGVMMNLWFWPFGGATSRLSIVPGSSVLFNLRRFITFHFATSLGFDIPRAVGNVVLVLIAGKPVLGALRRTARRAAFDAPVAFLSESRKAEQVEDGDGSAVHAPRHHR
jgi:energy-coupling factor transport system substrate-specific component